MESGNLRIEEHYFDEYYRVVVLEDASKYVVSVDVYKPSWEFSDYRSVCADSVCLLVKELLPSEVSLRVDVQGVERVVVLGVKTGDRFETINVKWFVRSKPTAEDIRQLYEHSWRMLK